MSDSLLKTDADMKYWAIMKGFQFGGPKVVLEQFRALWLGNTLVA
jgi:hypothetical protein